MARRFERTCARFPVDLVASGREGGVQTSASVVDLSLGGLRIQTGPALIPGRLLYVFREGQTHPFAYCRVVWAHTHGSDLPSEAGLEILQQISATPSVDPGWKGARGQAGSVR